MRRWVCRVCGYVYDENKGLRQERVKDTTWTHRVQQAIDPGARWEEIPKRFSCPECGIDKSEFKPQ